MFATLASCWTYLSLKLNVASDANFNRFGFWIFMMLHVSSCNVPAFSLSPPFFTIPPFSQFRFHFLPFPSFFFPWIVSLFPFFYRFDSLLLTPSKLREVGQHLIRAREPRLWIFSDPKVDDSADFRPAASHFRKCGVLRRFPLFISLFEFSS